MKIDAFLQQKYEPATKAVPWPDDLENPFEGTEKKELVFKSLSGNEAALIEYQASQRDVIAGIEEAIRSTDITAIKEKISGFINPDMPPQKVKELSYFKAALVYPEMTKSQAEELGKKLNKIRPTFFVRCVNTANILMGEGYTPGK